jgi:maltose alpha-D-glucosyltransferase / alpha-amylase
MIEIRKRHPALAVGSFTDLGGANPSVLAFLREHRTETSDEVLLRVHNLSRHPQPAQVPLGPGFVGYTPVELTGETKFPSIGLRPYLLTLPGHGWYWFRLDPPAHRGRRSTSRREPTADRDSVIGR